MTLGMANTEEDADYACRAIFDSVKRLREMSAMRPE
jgi:cysteine sulfinate desulfinase/cysteine desulfurase-like protein